MTPERGRGGGGGGGRPPGRGPRGGGGGRPQRGGGPHGHGSGGGIDPELLVYGRHPVREAARGRRRLKVVHVSPGAAEDLGTEFVAGLQAAGVDVRVVRDPEALDLLAGTSDHQGAVAEATPFRYVELDDVIAHARREGHEPLILCLDQVTDPHNLGAIARVADAAGASGILVPEHRSARVTGAAVKASAGALEHVLVARCTNLAREIRRVKDASIWAYAATERGTSDWTDVDLAGGALLILGAEGPGIRPNVLDACDVQVRIPMAGGVASLNVATVSAVLAFEAVRQRRAAGGAA